MRLSPRDAGLADLWFMTGTWSTPRDTSGNRVEEHWTTAEAGTLMGVSRTLRGGQTAFYEYLRIERTPEGIFYVAQPRGAQETRFKLVESGGNRAVFENPEHDFPTRIIYRGLPDGRLHARIEGQQRGQSRYEEWFYRPAEIAAATP